MIDPRAILKLLIALARAQGVSPEELAAIFADEEGCQEYYNQLLILANSPQDMATVDRLLKKWGYGGWVPVSQAEAVCVQCGRALEDEEGYHICGGCGGYLCDKCAAVASICSACAGVEEE